jgi:hypothetical protein
MYPQEIKAARTMKMMTAMIMEAKSLSALMRVS